jgi:uncharacterized membrane protein YbhN (UPF0104 family)
VVGFLSLFGVCLLLRTQRYFLLLKSSQSDILPTFWKLILITSVRNMLVDLLPARTGDLSFPVLLNRICQVGFSPAVSSFAYAFLFDILTLGPLLGIAVLAEGLAFTGPYPWLWLVAGSLSLLGIGLIFLLGPLTRCLSRLPQWEVRWSKKPALIKGARLFEGLNHSFKTLQEARVFWRLFFLSLAIRATKYGSLLLMVYAVLTAWLNGPPQFPFLIIFLGLVASEMAAGLPVSGIAGFGFYEGVLGTVLATQGIPASQALSLSFVVHLFTQVVDYTWGGAAFLLLMAGWLKGEKTGHKTQVSNSEVR